MQPEYILTHAFSNTPRARADVAGRPGLLNSATLRNTPGAPSVRGEGVHAAYRDVVEAANRQMAFLRELPPIYFDGLGQADSAATWLAAARARDKRPRQAAVRRQLGYVHMTRYVHDRVGARHGDQVVSALLRADAATAPREQSSESPDDIVVTSSYDVFVMDDPADAGATAAVVVIGNRAQGPRAEQEFASFGVLHTIEHIAVDMARNETFALAFDHVHVHYVYKNVADSFSGVARKRESIDYQSNGDRFRNRLGNEPARGFRLATVAFAPDPPARTPVVYCVVELE